MKDGLRSQYGRVHTGTVIIPYVCKKHKLCKTYNTTTDEHILELFNNLCIGEIPL